MKADLHTHTGFSDGTDTPEELVQHARQAGIEHLALTDHDTVEGIERFLTACDSTPGIKGYAGVELSAEYPEATLHIVGLGIDYRHPELTAALEWTQEGRRIRNDELLARLHHLGLNITREDVQEFAGTDLIGRLHVAQAMVKNGYADSISDAFEQWMRKGRPAYVTRRRLPARESIEIIRKAGGVAVLAHPYQWFKDEDKLSEGIGILVGYGLQAIEAYYTGYFGERLVALLRLADKYGLAVSAGSDYHGAGKPDIRLGELPDNATISVLDLLR